MWKLFLLNKWYTNIKIFKKYTIFFKNINIEFNKFENYTFFLKQSTSSLKNCNSIQFFIESKAGLDNRFASISNSGSSSSSSSVLTRIELNPFVVLNYWNRLNISGQCMENTTNTVLWYMKFCRTKIKPGLAGYL